MQPWISRRRWHPVVVSVAMVLAVLTGGGAALAGTSPPPTVHEPPYGVHSLRESVDQVAARCDYEDTGGGLALQSITVQPPVVLARNRTSSLDSEVVGWRFKVFAAAVPVIDWGAPIHTSTEQQGTAGERSTAPFTRRTFVLPDPPATDTGYALVVVMVWRGPSGGPILGRASHAVSTFRLVGADPDRLWDGFCPSHPTPAGPWAPAGTIANDVGAVGAHLLIDRLDEYQGARCDYGPALIESISVRAPVVFARNTGPGVQRQLVGWRFRVHEVLPASAGITAGPWSTVVKRMASERRNAAFARRSQAVADPVLMNAYSVEVRSIWYDADGHKVGHADHVVIAYAGPAIQSKDCAGGD